MKLAPTFSRLAAATLLALAGTTQAAIVNGADVGGFRTFVDTNTGRVWADLDNHLQFTGTGYALRFADFSHFMSALATAGFQWATWLEVDAFMAATPLTTISQHDDLGAVMSSLSFGEYSSFLGYANSFGATASRHGGSASYSNGTAHWSSTFTGAALPGALNDAGLWAYVASPGGPISGGSVPLPGTLALAGLGLLALGRRLRAAA